jgi:hypothetical protein
MSAAGEKFSERSVIATVEDQRSPSDERNASLFGAVMNDVGSNIIDFISFPADLARFHSALSEHSLRPLLKTSLGNNAKLSSHVHESGASAIWTARCGGVVRSVVFEASATTREVIEVAGACPVLQVANHLSYLYTLPFRLSYLYALHSPLSDQLNSTLLIYVFSLLCSSLTSNFSIAPSTLPSSLLYSNRFC